MYSEIEIDASGKIIGCWLADTLPENGGDNPLVTYPNGIPDGHELIRINIDTLMAMEIEEACKERAVIDPVTKEPKIQKFDRAEYVLKNFLVDKTKNIVIPTGVKMPKGMKMRELKRRPV